MIKVTTILGEAKILTARMSRTNRRGLYQIEIDYEFEGETLSTTVLSNDSELFDKVTGSTGDHSEILLRDARYMIEKEVEFAIGCN